ncbi:MAG: precorrin-6y C5,15-methyltransferase (decarboxylating) subunit CbiE [Patulibacter sp.]
MSARLTVVGIGEDGWAGLSARAQEALRGATLVLGGARQLALLPGDAVVAQREAWPSPMLPRVEQLAAATTAGEPQIARTVVLGSGDPMLHGIGATLARLTDPALLDVLPVPSAYSLACARLGWAQHEVPLVSLVADPQHDPLPALAGGRAIVYVPGRAGARRLAALLRDAGLGGAQLTILSRLGGEHEARLDVTADEFDDDGDPLHLVAVDARGVVPAPERRRLMSAVPGLPDALYGGDGQLTRAEPRAIALAALAPSPGELLWDVGAGSGTIAIEWCRAASRARAVAIERREDRCATIAGNARTLGASRVQVVCGELPGALELLPALDAAPDAIFIGGATSQPGLIDRCWQALRPGGRLVASAVTFDSEQALIAAHRRFGGRLLRLAHDHAGMIGSFAAWTPQRPIVQWSAVKQEQGAA